MKVLKFKDLINEPVGTIFIERRTDGAYEGPLSRKEDDEDDGYIRTSAIVPANFPEWYFDGFLDYEWEYLVFEKEDVEELIEKLK